MKESILPSFLQNSKSIKQVIFKTSFTVTLAVIALLLFGILFQSFFPDLSKSILDFNRR